jgi:hypothetical protein
MSRRKQVWLVLSVVYLLILVATALWYLLDPELSTDDKVLTSVGVAAIPATAFVAATVPLWRNSRNRAALVAAELFALFAAWFQLMLTFGFALPLSAVLIAVAYLDSKRIPRRRRDSR